MTETTTEPTSRHPGGPRRGPDLRRAAQRRRHRAGPVHDRRRRWAPPGSARSRALHRPHGRDLRPARVGAQHAHRRRHADHARGARRRPAPADLGARCRAGGPLRQQRRRGERAGPGGRAPGAGADARRARAADSPRCCPIASRRWPRPATSTRRTSAAAWAPAMAKFIALVSHKGEIPADWPDRPAPDPAAVRAADRGRRLAGRPAARPEHGLDAPSTSPTSMPSARRRPASSSPPAPSPRASWPTAAPSPSPSGWGRRRSPSRATTADSSAASTASRASPTPSPRSCARCSPGPERLAGGGRLVPLP